MGSVKPAVFARAGLGGGEQIAAFQDLGNGLGLWMGWARCSRSR